MSCSDAVPFFEDTVEHVQSVFCGHGIGQSADVCWLCFSCATILFDVVRFLCQHFPGSVDCYNERVGAGNKGVINVKYLILII